MWHSVAPGLSLKQTMVKANSSPRSEVCWTTWPQLSEWHLWADLLLDWSNYAGGQSMLIGRQSTTFHKLSWTSWGSTHRTATYVRERENLDMSISHPNCVHLYCFILHSVTAIYFCCLYSHCNALSLHISPIKDSECKLVFSIVFIHVYSACTFHP